MANSSSAYKQNTTARNTKGSTTRKNSGSTTRKTNQTKSRSNNSSKKTNSKSKKSQNRDISVWEDPIYREIILIGVACVSVLLFLCNFGIIGPVGDAISKVMFGLFGFMAYIAPICVAALFFFRASNYGNDIARLKEAAAVLMFFLIGNICEMVNGFTNFSTEYSLKELYEKSSGKTGGGVLSGSVTFFLCKHMGKIGCGFLVVALLIVCLIVVTEKSLLRTLKNGGLFAYEKAQNSKERVAEFKENYKEHTQERRERMIEEEEYLEQERILRMDKKASGVAILNLEPLDAEEAKDVERIRDDMHEIVLNEVDFANAKKKKARRKKESTETFQPNEHYDWMKNQSDYFKETDSNASGAPFEEQSDFFKTGGFDINNNVLSQGGSDNLREVFPQEQNEWSQSQDDFFSRGENSFHENSSMEDGFFNGFAKDYSEGFSEGFSGIESHQIQSEDDYYFSPLSAGGRGTVSAGGMDGFAGAVGNKGMDGFAGAVGNKGMDGFAGAGGNRGMNAFSEMPGHRGMESDFDDIVPNDGHFFEDEPPVSKARGGEDFSADGRPKAKLNPKMDPKVTNETAMEIQKNQAKPPRKYIKPSVNLLKKNSSKQSGDSERQIRETAKRLQETLANFGVNVKITDVSQGPTVTRYEFQPEQGVKVSKIVGLTDDIKLNLAATDIRMEAPIPGKAAIGIEIPNNEVVSVSFRELIDNNEFKNFPSKLAFAVGKDIGGKVIVTDISKMPHVLIAGATGSGKSVCINTIIMSLLYKADPNEVKMIMIDPKVVELSVYNGIPHLLIPVVTDPKKAAGALQWGVAEMTDRYKKFADFNVRDLKGYNQKVEEMERKGEENVPEKLPQIVIIVDELADLMMVAPGEVEESICRLAQLARAAGIHLIIATQRPSVDVITGLIKANMPSRIAFAVSSGVDSRTILDMVGAEKLLGKGDMLFYPQGYSKPARLQGAFVSDEEVSNVVDFLKNQVIGNVYDESIQDKIQNMKAQASEGGASMEGGSSVDDYFIEAGRFIIDKDKASIGMLQRVFKVGFNRAARIMDQLCEAGVVGPEEGTKPRKILMSASEFEQYVEEYL